MWPEATQENISPVHLSRKEVNGQETLARYASSSLASLQLCHPSIDSGQLFFWRCWGWFYFEINFARLKKKLLPWDSVVIGLTVVLNLLHLKRRITNIYIFLPCTESKVTKSRSKLHSRPRARWHMRRSSQSAPEYTLSLKKPPTVNKRFWPPLKLVPKKPSRS